MSQYEIASPFVPGFGSYCIEMTENGFCLTTHGQVNALDWANRGVLKFD
jgi:hypothetical protein